MIRRAYFDLHGLPPAAEKIDSFVNDKSPDAYDKLIDELLASPRYGEKWGRHWLDLVRYGDTSGFEQDPYLLYAWRYRDYVIDSFNQDKPYDRFVKEQIAGDELYPDDPVAQSGTGYFTVGPNRDMLYKVEDVNRIETLTDYVDTTGSVFLGLSVGCARCHDHKFDPIPQRDYYRMQAIFVPAEKTRVFLQYDPARGYDLAENLRHAKLREMGDQLESILRPYQKKLSDEKLAKLPADVRDAFATDEAKRTPAQRAIVEENRRKINAPPEQVRAALTPDHAAALHKIEIQLVSMFTGFKAGPFAPSVHDISREAPKTFLPQRPGKPPEEVGPGLLTALGGGDIPEPPVDAISTGRRKALAEWIASPSNPTAARVMVNRIWQYHFGKGIVSTVSDFGVRGSAPSHPELLDWLATEFMANGWSMKKLHRQIMLSSAYRQSSTPSPEALERDAENRLLSHMNRRRLFPEEIRDSMLQSSGALNLKMGGRPVVPPVAREELYGLSQSADNMWIITANAEEQNRRSIYMLSRRTFRPAMFESFDAPDGIRSCSRREASNTAPQSLTLLNGRWTVDESKRLAAAVAKDDAGESAVATSAWRRILGRDPDSEELERARKFVRDQKSELGSLSGAAPNWPELCSTPTNSCTWTDCHETFIETRSVDASRPGFGSVALASMLEAASRNPLAPKAAHQAAKAKSVIYLFMHGGVSHVDTFDPKPELAKRSGECISADAAKGLKTNRIDFSKAPMRGSPWKFERRGQSGMEISELFPNIGSKADEIALIRSCYGEAFDHAPAIYLRNTGSQFPGQPCLGSWVVYGLGSESQNLPAFVVMSDGATKSGPQAYSSGFLPAVYQGTVFRGGQLRS